MMSKEELLLEYWRELSPDYQQSLIHFAEFLHGKAHTPKPRPNIKGLCVDLDIDLSLDDFTEARREMFKLDRLLDKHIGVVSFQPDDLSDRTHSAYSEALQLKYKNLNS